MFTFQAIHNKKTPILFMNRDVKELISMFTFQAIHNPLTDLSDENIDVKELIYFSSNSQHGVLLVDHVS